MEQVRFGIIGYGVQGSVYAAMLAGDTTPHCALAAVSTTSAENAAAIAAAYPGVRVFGDWKTLITSGAVDAVVITLPHYFHHEVAIFAMEQGIHVLVEKPAGIRAKDVLAMNACAQSHPELTFGILFNQRTNRLYQRIRKLVQSGELGTLRRSVWIINTWWRPDSYYRQSQWRATWGGEGGGVLVNQAPHQLDLWQWICGMPIRLVSKNLHGAHREIATENDVTMVVEYENGATGVFLTCTHDPMGTDRLEIDLSQGKIVVEGGKQATIYRLRKDESELNATMTTQEAAQLTRSNAAGSSLYDVEEFSHTDGPGVQHAAIFEDFAASVLTGSPLLAPGIEGIHSVNLANASQLSAWAEQWVGIPVDPEAYAQALNEKIRAEGKYPTRD